MTWVWLSGLVLATGMILLVRQWTWLVAGLLVGYLCVAGLLAQQQLATDLAGDSVRWLLPLSEVVSGVVIAGILALTGLTFAQGPHVEQLDEWSLLELRRVARRASQTAQPVGWSEYLLPSAGFIVVLVAAVLLPRIYGLNKVGGGGSAAAPFAWSLLLLTGLVQLIIGQNMLKLGCGVLVIGLGLQLFYLDWSTSIGLAVLALLHIAMIVLALVVAYLSSLLYDRLHTLELGELYHRGSGA